MTGRKKVLLGVGGLLLLIASITLYILFYANYSKGYRAGTIMKMSKKGVAFKTFEGQLLLGGFENSGSDPTNVWNFSVRKKDKQVLEDIENAVDHGHRVKLYYNEKYYQWSWKGDTRYFVYKVEKIGVDPGD